MWVSKAEWISVLARLDRLEHKDRNTYFDAETKLGRFALVNTKDVINQILKYLGLRLKYSWDTSPVYLEKYTKELK